MQSATRNGSSGALIGGLPVNRLFDVFFGVDPCRAPERAMHAFVPLSTWEDENYIYAEVDAPGILDQDIDISLQDDELTIRFDRKQGQQAEGYDSRRYGQFEQRLTLWSPVDPDKVEATLARGVLSVRCTKSEKAKPRKIAVTSAQ